MIKIQDNIISQYYQDYIEDLTTSKFRMHPYPLFYTPKITTGDSKSENEFGFSHMFFANDEPYPNHCTLRHFGISLFQPLFSFIEKQKLIINKIYTSRVFLLTPTEKNKSYIPHKDLPFPHLAAIYYVNDTDGDTIFYDNDYNIIKTVSPKKGRIVVFDGNIFHGASTPTLDKRVIINYNFDLFNLNQNNNENNEIRSRKSPLGNV
jgi:hypothetical protein